MGELTIRKADVYDPSKCNDVVFGKISKERAKRELIESFNRDQMGMVSQGAFEEVMSCISNSTPDDETFIQLLEGCWKVRETKEVNVDPADLKRTAQELRSSLLGMTKGCQDEKLNRRVFKEFDRNSSGLLTIDELESMLSRFQIQAKAACVRESFRLIDRNRNGYIEYDEFVRFIREKPLE